VFEDHGAVEAPITAMAREMVNVLLIIKMEVAIKCLQN
jgi:hypothetical protein